MEFDITFQRFWSLIVPCVITDDIRSALRVGYQAEGYDNVAEVRPTYVVLHIPRLAYRGTHGHISESSSFVFFPKESEPNRNEKSFKRLDLAGFTRR
jgi:hypothetical protein